MNERKRQNTKTIKRERERERDSIPCFDWAKLFTEDFLGIKVTSAGVKAPGPPPGPPPKEMKKEAATTVDPNDL